MLKRFSSFQSNIPFYFPLIRNLSFKSVKSDRSPISSKLLQREIKIAKNRDEISQLIRKHKFNFDTINLVTLLATASNMGFKLDSHEIHALITVLERRHHRLSAQSIGNALYSLQLYNGTETGLKYLLVGIAGKVYLLECLNKLIDKFTYPH